MPASFAEKVAASAPPLPNLPRTPELRASLTPHPTLQPPCPTAAKRHAPPPQMHPITGTQPNCSKKSGYANIGK